MVSDSFKPGRAIDSRFVNQFIAIYSDRLLIPVTSIKKNNFKVNTLHVDCIGS